MKFKVSSKDLIMFIIFCVFLLYLCAIGVMNFVEFSRTGSFWGFNPFPAFSKDYFAATLVFFAIALIIIFTSVSSYIFDREKGKGIGLIIGESEEKGYSRWAKDKEIKTDKDIFQITPTSKYSDVAGIPLINDGKDIWVDNGEYHNLVIGATGSGKTETIVKPMVNILARAGESMIITDPKGEIYRYSAAELKDRGYKIIVLNFREPQNGNAWNPLTLPYRLYKEGNKDKATELLDDVALNIIYDENNKAEPFWEKSAADFFSGLTLGLFEDAKEEEININSISYMATVGEERFATSNYSKEYFNLKGETTDAYIFASNTINAPNETKGSILSVFRQKIRLFASREQLSEMLSHSDFDMRDIGKEKTAVFMIIHDEKTTYHSLATIFIKQCYESLIAAAQDKGGKLSVRTNFLLDEFANMPPLKDVDSMVTAARSRRIRFTFIIQNYAQLNDVYDKKAETIKGNCGNLIYLISTELAALEEISKMAGEVKSKEKDKTVSTPLVTVTDLQKLKLFEAIILRWRLHPFKTKYKPDFEMDWGNIKDPVDYPHRTMKPVEIFDMKNFVKEERRKKLFSSMEGSSSDEVKAMENMSSNIFNPTSGNAPAPIPGLNPNSSDFNVDDFIKQIDAEIAKLEAEEKAASEAEKKQKEEKIKEEKIKEETKVPVETTEQEVVTTAKSIKEIEKPKINIDVDSVIVDDKVITDDQFFDDFFGDE